MTGSFVVEGIVEFLLGKSFEADYLKEHVRFKVIPMVNVDGVLHGNQRCSLDGYDLNRRWQSQ